MTTIQAPAGLVVSPAAPSHSSSSAAASCASPGNSSAVPLKVTSQAGVDSPPSGKTGQVYSSGAFGRPFISSSKTPSGSASVSSVAKSPPKQSTLSHTANAGAVSTASNGGVVTSPGTMAAFSSAVSQQVLSGVQAGSGSLSLPTSSSPGHQPGSSNVPTSVSGQSGHAPTSSSPMSGVSKPNLFLQEEQCSTNHLA